MTDGLRKSHLRKAPQVGLSEVGLPEGNLLNVLSIPNKSEKLGQELAESRQVKTGGCKHCWKKRKK